MHLKPNFDLFYIQFNKKIGYEDPIYFPHKFKNEMDIEVVAFISAIFAYGNISQIMNSINKIVIRLGENPYNKIISFKSNELDIFNDVKHRFYSSNDIKILILLIQKIIREYKSIKNLFLKNYQPDELNLKSAISEFSNYCLKEINEISQIPVVSKNFRNKNLSLGLKFMFPLPEKGSACKRINLFLRWMIRKDKIDFGLWHEFPKNKLIIPVDTHIAKISRHLNLTKRKNISWLMAEEITANLKKINPRDPIKYDFALCHLGIKNKIK